MGAIKNVATIPLSRLRGLFQAGSQKLSLRAEVPGGRLGDVGSGVREAQRDSETGKSQASVNANGTGQDTERWRRKTQRGHQMHCVGFISEMASLAVRD